MNNKNVRRIIHYGLLVVIIIYVVTGFGISKNRTIGPLTLELLSKPAAFRIHTYLIYPLIVFLYLHIILTYKKNKSQKEKKKDID